MIRVGADANVLISAALARDPRAPSVLVFEAGLDGRFELVASPALLAEVLQRPEQVRELCAGAAQAFT